jgi:MFS transporter, MHS family, proline/betaine transporter
MNERKIIFATLVGNTMEFYDFIVYAFMSKYISVLFFPNKDNITALIATFIVFASGYLTRPIGALFFGHIGDRYGRKISLYYSIAAITVATLLIGFLPTYSSVGILAPILLMLCRLVQGFSVSGEEGGAAVYLTEMVGNNKASYAGSLILGSVYFGVLLGSIVCLIVNLLFNDDQIYAFAWRIPFILSIILGIISLQLRKQMAESPSFHKRAAVKNPVLRLFSKSYMLLIVDIFLVVALAVPIYLFNIFIPSYLGSILKIHAVKAQAISVCCLISLSIGVPMLGLLADKIGKYKVFVAGCIYNIAIGYLSFYLISLGSTIWMLLGLTLIGLGLLLIAGPIFAILMYSYDPEVRFTAVSFVFNTSMSVFGSLTPIVAFYMIAGSNSNAIPGLLIIGSGVVGLLSLWIRVIQQKTFYIEE